MADTITIGGKKLPKNYLMIAGAVGVGIVGYAYYQRSAGGEVEEELGVVDEFGDERITPTTLDTYDVKVDNRTGYKTDSEWYDAAVDYLTLNYGAEFGMATDAVNKYLANTPLKAAQVPMMQSVVNSLGPPPSGSRTIRQETTTTPPPAQNSRAKPGSITDLRLEGASGQDITVIWKPAINATKYKVRAIAGNNTTLGSTTVSTPRFRFRSIIGKPLQPNSPYRIEVWGVNAAGDLGPRASKTFRTTGR